MTGSSRRTRSRRVGSWSKADGGYGPAGAEAVPPLTVARLSSPTIIGGAASEDVIDNGSDSDEKTLQETATRQ